MAKSVDYSEEQSNCAPERQRDGGEEEVGVQEFQDGRRLRVALLGFVAHLRREILHLLRTIYCGFCEDLGESIESGPCLSVLHICKWGHPCFFLKHAHYSYCSVQGFSSRVNKCDLIPFMD